MAQHLSAAGFQAALRDKDMPGLMWGGGGGGGGGLRGGGITGETTLWLWCQVSATPNENSRGSNWLD